MIFIRGKDTEGKASLKVLNTLFFVGIFQIETLIVLHAYIFICLFDKNNFVTIEPLFLASN